MLLAKRLTGAAGSTDKFFFETSERRKVPAGHAQKGPADISMCLGSA